MLKILRQYSLLFWLALILMTGFSILLFASYSISKKSLQGEFSEQILSNIGNNLQSSIERELIGPGLIAAQMANNNFLRDAISSEESDPAAIQKYLKEIQTKNHLNSVFLISDLTHQYYRDTPDVKSVSETEKSDQWYFKFAQKKQSFESSIESYDGSIENISMLFTQRIVAEDGKYLGLAGVRLNLTWLPEIVQKEQKHAGMHIYCIDNKGKFILPNTFALLSEKTPSIYVSSNN